MQMRYIIFYCLFMFGTIISLPPKHFSFNDIYTTISELTNFNNPRFLFQSTIVTGSGIYMLSRNIDFTPTTTNEPCITIDADNVILDLNRKTITQINSMPGAMAIQVNPGHSNTVIRNGYLHKFTGPSVKVGDGNENMALQLMIIIDIGSCGLLLDGNPTGTGINNISVSNSSVSSGMAGFSDICGLRATNCTVLDIENCTFNSLVSTGSCAGIDINKSRTIRITSSFTSENKATNNAFGIHLNNVTNVDIFDCLSSRNSSTGLDPNSRCIGLALENVRGIAIEESACFSNVGTFTAVGVLISSCTGVIMTGCFADGTVSALSDSIGIHIQNSKNIIIQDGFIEGNTGLVNGFGALITGVSSSINLSCNAIRKNDGILNASFGIANSTGLDCVFQDNKLGQHTGGTFGFGLFDQQVTTSQNLITGNFGIKNTVNFFPADSMLIFLGPFTTNPSIFENVSLSFVGPSTTTLFDNPAFANVLNNILS